jgi:archaellin
MALNRKAVMGIGTLIIFIATILVAAVAAGVIISTSGVLQQKALIIGEQAQNRLINGIEVTHVFVAGNTTAKTANNFEILTRPEPAAGPINWKQTSLSVFTDEGAYSAELEHPSLITFNETVSAAVTTTWGAFGDLDGDGYQDYIRVVVTSNASNDYVQLNLSETGLTDQVDVGFDLDATSAVNFSDLPITGQNTTYGYLHVEDVTHTADQFDAGTARVTDLFEGDCSFDVLIPETKFCLVTMVGTDDWYLEYGETVFVYYKMKSQNVLLENDEVELKIFPQDGRSTYILDRIPQVIYKRRINLYP